MAFIALGINHKSASVALREKIAFGPDAMPRAYTELQELDGVDGAVVLSTCNRTELYVYGIKHSQDLIQWLHQFHQLPENTLSDCLYLHRENDAVHHLMRVASGLDSLVLGEPQILGQVKQSFAQAKAAGALNFTLERMFHKVFSVAKQVRTDTEIGSSAVSVAFASVNLAKQIFGELDKARVLLIGAGETIELVAKHLYEQGARDLTVANRTLDKARLIADNFNGRAVTLHQVSDMLSHADIVISSTAAPLPIVGVGAVDNALKKRRRQPMLLVDLAVPRDIEKEVGELRDAYLYAVDDLQTIVEQNRSARQEAAEEAELIVRHQTEQFAEWLRSLSGVNLIKQVRSQGEAIRDELVESAMLSLEKGQDPQVVLQNMAYKLTNRLLHPTTRMIQNASTHASNDDMTNLISVLGLDGQQKEHS